jgi:hypothetical protein
MQTQTLPLGAFSPLIPVAAGVFWLRKLCKTRNGALGRFL